MLNNGFCYRKLEEDFGIFPKTIRVSAKTIAQDLVSVQPMPAPSGRVWYETDEQRLAREALKKSEERNKAIDEIIKDL